MDIQQLKTFVTVVRLGSFAAAARQLDMAPSMVSRSVAALEAELGVRLMQRSTRKAALTEAGARYHAQVSEILEGLERAADDARAASGATQRGSVRLTTSVAYGQTLIVPLLADLHALHPGIEIELLLSDAVFDLVAERIDLALRLGPAVDSALVGFQLARVAYRVVASPAYLARHGRPERPGELADRDCLRFALPGFRSQWRFRSPAGAEQSVDVRGWLLLSTAMAVHQAARDGLGPALLADWLAGPDIAAGRLVDLFPDYEVTAADFDRGIWLLYASRAYLPGRVRAVIDFLKARLGEAQPGLKKPNSN